MQLDADGKLIFEIKNQLPIELADLTKALSSLAKEFEAFAYSDESRLDGAYRSETRLYVKAIRTGSIISELVPYAPTLLPILSDVNTVVGFAKHIKTSIDVMLASEKEPKSKISTPTLENLRSIVEPVAKDSASQVILTGDIHIHAPITVALGSKDARSLQFEIDRALENRHKPTHDPHKNVVMHWYQARNDASSAVGDRAIIESVWPKPVKVVFESPKVKYHMLKMKENLFEHAFLVDVQVETVLEKPTQYTIVAFHRDLGRREFPFRRRRAKRTPRK